MKKSIILILLLIFIFINTGCVQRKLTVKSNPPGADVYFNEEHRGKTPVDFDFKWYWTHKVELRKEGYQPVVNYETIKAPVYMWMPFDLAMELLPFTIRDSHELAYDLKLREEAPDDNEVVIEEINFE
jgi:hypothetical protein